MNMPITFYTNMVNNNLLTEIKEAQTVMIFKSGKLIH